MPRVRRGSARNRAKNRLFKKVKGFRAGRGNLLRMAKQSLIRSRVYAYRDRRKRKRDFRKLWIVRINAAVRQRGLTYSQFIAGLAAANIEIDRPMLAELAVNDPATFDQIVESVRAALGQAAPEPAAG